MPKFSYRAKDESGKSVEGVMEASSEAHLVNILKKGGYFILDITEEKKGALGGKKTAAGVSVFSFLGRIKQRDVIVFSRQLSTMLHAGVAFVDALSVIGEQTENAKLKEILKEMTQAVKEGAFFSQAIAKYPKIFSQLYVSMVEVGEAGGALEDVLNRIVFIMENEEETKTRIKSALTYPVIIIFIVFGVVGFLTTFVFPKFITIFQSSGVSLPTPTRILFGFSRIARKFFFLWVALFFGAAYLFRRYRGTEVGRYTTDRLILFLPLVGNLVKKVSLGRFTRTLATLYSSGVPILRSLEIVERGIGNRVLLKIIRHIHDEVREGKSLAKPMSAYKIFPPMMIQMISVGEETGSISDMLNEVAKSYETEVEFALKNLTTAIEPLLIVFMGVIVGLTALSLFLPMFDMMKLVH